MLNFPRILITGGAGFVGSSLACAIRQDRPDIKVMAFDNLMCRGSELNLPRLRAAGVEFLHGDIRNPTDLQEAGQFDLLIDCAAEPSVQAGMNGSPRPVLDNNLFGTVNCLEAARVNNAAFLFLSSSRVYPIQTLNQTPWVESSTRFEWTRVADSTGISPEGVTEDFPLQGARSWYGASKLASEVVAQEYAASAGMQVLINRCGVLTGPWQMGKVDQGVVALWVMRHHFGLPLKYMGYGGTGQQVRDILHVQDLYALIRRQLSAPSLWDGRIYNVGGGKRVSISLAELTEMCQLVTGNIVPISSVPKTSDVDLRIYLTDSSQVQRDFDWKPRLLPEQIVQDIHCWVKENESALRPIAGASATTKAVVGTVTESGGPI